MSETELPCALRSCERMYSVSGPASLICCAGDRMRCGAMGWSGLARAASGLCGGNGG